MITDKKTRQTSIIFLTIQYSLLQMIYWMAYCSIIGFALFYLKYLGFSVAQVGVILALSNIFSVILQPIVGYLSDQSSQIHLKYTISFLSFLVILMLGSLAMFNISSLMIIGGIFTLMSTIILIIQPLMNSLILEFINQGIPVNYGLARGLGSFSFAILSFLLVKITYDYGANSLPYIGIILYFFIICIALTFKKTISFTEKGLSSRDNKFKISEALSFISHYDKLHIFLIGIAFLFIFDSVVNTYILEIVLNVNGKDSDVGIALGIAAFVELPGMMAFAYIARCIKVNAILLFSAIMFSVKSIALLYSTNVNIVYLSQGLQCVSFALLLPAAVHYINSVVNKIDLVKGQAILMTSITFGGVFGTLVGGVIAEKFSVFYMLLFGVVCAISGTIFLFLSLKNNVIPTINSQ